MSHSASYSSKLASAQYFQDGDNSSGSYWLLNNQVIGSRVNEHLEMLFSVYSTQFWDVMEVLKVMSFPFQNRAYFCKSYQLQVAQG